MLPTFLQLISLLVIKETRVSAQGVYKASQTVCSDPKDPDGVWQEGCIVRTCKSGAVEERLADECVQLIEKIVEEKLVEKLAAKVTPPLGVIVSGGWNGGTMASTEVYFPAPGSGYTCSLQRMPSGRRGHTLDQLGDGTVLACGGYPDNPNTCDKFNGTYWSRHSTLLNSRGQHTSLPGQHDLLLMGGYYSQATTELVEGGGGEKYNLQQDTYRACGITEPGSDYIILTGGWGSGDTVVKYNKDGFLGKLPDLKIARSSHGCGVFDTITGQKVYVVAGGYKVNHGALSSTELLYDGGLSWVTGQALPRTLDVPASVSFADSVLLIGGYAGGKDYRPEILSFNSSLAWTVVGTLKEGRSAAAAAALTFDRSQLDFYGYCPK